LDLKLIPQGTLAERIRAGRAVIPAFYTPTGVGTLVAAWKESRLFDGRKYLLERWLKADFALIKTWKGDSLGNLVYRKTARTFNLMMAAAPRVTIAEVEHLVELGRFSPKRSSRRASMFRESFRGLGYENRIEPRTARKKAISA
jgi:3-oxoacid CoA-transferase subunit A